MKIHLVHPRLGGTTRSWITLSVALFCAVMARQVSGQAAPSNSLSWGDPAPRGGQLVHNGETFQVVAPSQVPTAASLANGGTLVETSVGSMDDPGMAAASMQLEPSHLPSSFQGSCTTCNAGAGGAGSSARFGLLGRGRGGWKSGSGRDPLECPGCDPYRYVTVEGLYMERREGDSFTLARDFRLDDFQYEWAPRITLGTVPDCVHGTEISFVGFLEWDIGLEAFDAGDTLQTLLTPVPPLVVGDLDTFGNARSQVQTYDAEYWSIEASRTLNGWGLSQFLYGVRYIDYSEEYRYVSFDATDGTGLLRSDTENQLIGGQIGLDLIYPIARIAYVDFRSRAGAYANFADSAVDLVNDGTPLVSTRDDDVQLAGMFEIGAGLRVELGEMLAIRGGYEIWYLTEIATADQQIRSSVSRTMGDPIDVGNDFLIVGATVGAELKF